MNGKHGLSPPRSRPAREKSSPSKRSARVFQPLSLLRDAPRGATAKALGDALIVLSFTVRNYNAGQALLTTATWQE
jgi:hypothetical protein